MSVSTAHGDHLGSVPLLERDALEAAAETARATWAGGNVSPWGDLSEHSRSAYRDLAEATVIAYFEWLEK